MPTTLNRISVSAGFMFFTIEGMVNFQINKAIQRQTIRIVFFSFSKFGSIFTTLRSPPNFADHRTNAFKNPSRQKTN